MSVVTHLEAAIDRADHHTTYYRQRTKTDGCESGTTSMRSVASTNLFVIFARSAANCQAGLGVEEVGIVDVHRDLDVVAGPGR